MSDVPDHTSERGAISTRTAELVVAAILLSLGLLVIYDSNRLGSSWGSDGPEAGYFPFYIGLLMAVASIGNLLRALRHRELSQSVFVAGPALRQVLAVLVPALLYVLAIQLIGLYVASAIYIAGFMRLLGGYGWARSVLVGVLVSALAWATFEIWFQVPLYKGAFNPLAIFGY